ncbi:MAG TPA: ThiF family adenylyltransferase, partial [Acidiphilium sp.]|nr:ThiF family adenylyltransferase [Acidiphilium sp.]
MRDSIVGFAGLGGGGSHIVQQLSYIGIGTLVPVDPDHVEDSNLNRLVGATDADVAAGTPKTVVAERVIKATNPKAQVTPVIGHWQEAHLELRRCTCLFGCVDSWTKREQLERFARRFLIP